METHARIHPVLRVMLVNLIGCVVVPLALLGMTEGVLRLCGYGHSTRFYRPCERNGVKGHCENQRFSWLFFPPALARTTEPFFLPAEKGSNTFRVFVLGGSAAQGVPDTAYSMARMLDVMLRVRYPGRRFEVVNAAMTAINSHAVRLIARDCLDLDPDLLIVYMGHNEVVGPYGAGTVLTRRVPPRWRIRLELFVKSTRTGQLLSGWFGRRGAPTHWRGMEMFIAQQIRSTDPLLEKVYGNFSENLDGICSSAARAKVPLVVCTVGSNVKDCPPFVSLHGVGMPTDQIAAWQEAFDEGQQCEQAGIWARAASNYARAAQLDPGHAETWFRLGTARWAAGRRDPVTASVFDEARDRDTLRFRADRRINALVWSNESRGAVIADAAAGLAAAAPGGVPGASLFYEHVHLTFTGAYTVAALLAAKIAQMQPSWQAARAVPSLDECAAALCFTPWDEYRVMKDVLNTYLRKPPFTGQSGHSNLVARIDAAVQQMFRALTPIVLAGVEHTYSAAIARAPDDYQIRLACSKFLLAAKQDREASLRELLAVQELIPENADVYESIGKVYLALQRHDKALDAFQHARELSPASATLCNNVGIAYTLLGDRAAAERMFRHAISLDPGNAMSHNDLGTVLFQDGRVDEAIKAFNDALACDKDSAQAHSNLGLAHARKGEYTAARVQYIEALRADPDDVQALVGFGVLCVQDARYDEAIPLLERALKNSSDNPSIAKMLATARALRERARIHAVPLNPNAGSGPKL